ncbi:MAG: hypothetical protein GY719_03155 [bacterium]|nr:hypothetical protein [bacterium]
MTAGDIALLPHGDAHEIAHARDAETSPAEEVLEKMAATRGRRVGGWAARRFGGRRSPGRGLADADPAGVLRPHSPTKRFRRRGARSPPRAGALRASRRLRAGLVPQ